MKPQNPNFVSRVKEIFHSAPFIQYLGIQLEDIGAGWCETSLEVRAEHFQQDQVLHAGVLSTMADHTAGAAAGTLIANDQIVLTVEFKVNLLRAARGERLRARAKILRPGKRLSVAESEVFSQEKDSEVLVAKALVTLAVLEKT